MESFTSLEQSKKLAEFLPLESADAHYVRKITDFRGNPVDGKWSEPKFGNPEKANYIIHWLKSLKERYTWKPSDEQIEALESATENCAYSDYQDCLRELIGQLKKLKE